MSSIVLIIVTKMPKIKGPEWKHVKIIEEKEKGQPRVQCEYCDYTQRACDLVYVFSNLRMVRFASDVNYRAEYVEWAGISSGEEPGISGSEADDEGSSAFGSGSESE